MATQAAANAMHDPFAAAVSDWLRRFEAALSENRSAGLAGLFADDGFWRDLLALTWSIETHAGPDRIAAALLAAGARGKTRNFRIDPQRSPGHRALRAGTQCWEVFIRFEAAHGEGCGVVRFKLNADGTPAAHAWTLLTALETLDAVQTRPAVEKAHARDFRGPNWLDVRRQRAAYHDRDPAVVVVGAGQAGLAIAARLTALGVDTLIVDREKRIGDNWRNRYHALTLHNQTHVNHLPFMPFPPTWPTYIPKDKLASWLEAYAEAMELNTWTETEFEGGTYDAENGRWTVTLRKACGSVRHMHPRHVVLATGVSGIANIPNIPSLSTFQGRVLHASQYQDGEAWEGKHAIVIGSGNSGHDIAQDLYSGGARVTLVQRGTTMVVNLDTAQLPYALYSEGMPTEDCDLVTAAMPLDLARKSHQHLTAQARQLDARLLDSLRAKGFQLDFGDDDTGWQFKYLSRGGGYYFNVGCSELIADGKIRLLQYSDIAAFTPDGTRLKDGTSIAADLIVLATGYKGQEHLLRKLFGEEVAVRVGPVWGFGSGRELRNMYVRTPQPGLWFIAGSLAQCRIYSKYLALQIKAMEAGLIGPKPSNS